MEAHSPSLHSHPSNAAQKASLTSPHPYLEGAAATPVMSETCVSKYAHVCVRACALARVCVSAGVYACVRMCVHASVSPGVRAHVRVHVRAYARALALTTERWGGNAARRIATRST